MIARFIGGPLDGRTQELPVGRDGMTQPEISCEIKDQVLLDPRGMQWQQLEQAVTVRKVTYVRTVNPLDEGPLVVYLAADPAEWDSESANA